jgi:hypothetical protein
MVVWPPAFGRGGTTQLAVWIEVTLHLSDVDGMTAAIVEVRIVIRDGSGHLRGRLARRQDW